MIWDFPKPLNQLQYTQVLKWLKHYSHEPSPFHSQAQSCLWLQGWLSETTW